MVCLVCNISVQDMDQLLVYDRLVYDSLEYLLLVSAARNNPCLICMSSCQICLHLRLNVYTCADMSDW